jgi:hypothetical protein
VDSLNQEQDDEEEACRRKCPPKPSHEFLAAKEFLLFRRFGILVPRETV